VAKVIRYIPLFLLFVSVENQAILHAPFPTGSTMATLGTIVYEDGPSGRDPLLSAVFMNNRCKAGVALSVTTFYDDMDNYTDRRIAAVTGGGYFSTRRLLFKTAVTHFDALGAYYEQNGYFSCAMYVIKGIRIGAEFTGTRLHCVIPGYTSVIYGETGFSLFVPVFPIFFAASVYHLPVKTTRIDGADPLPVIQFGMYTARHAFGAQGVRFDIAPGLVHPVHFAIGQEVRLHKSIAICGAIANNPFLIGFGISVALKCGVATAALVDHPVLGWSHGFSAEYGFNTE
jgi:hypothetical protein